jgi:hypothetical protein
MRELEIQRGAYDANPLVPMRGNEANNFRFAKAVMSMLIRASSKIRSGIAR